MRLGNPKHDGKVGYWTEENMIKMEEAHDAAMRKHHNRGFNGQPLGAVPIEPASKLVPAKSPEPSVSPADFAAMRDAIESFAQGNSERKTIAKQICLVLLSVKYGDKLAVRAFGVLPETMNYARRKIIPAIAAAALSPDVSRKCFDEIAGIVCQNRPSRWTRADLLNIAAEAFGARPSDLESHRRRKCETRPRMVGMFLCQHFTPSSYPEIGRSFGDRDHSTVIHAVRKMTALASEHKIDGGDDPVKWAEAFKAVLR